jgi:hypothetical protein
MVASLFFERVKTHICELGMQEIPLGACGVKLGLKFVNGCGC